MESVNVDEPLLPEGMFPNLGGHKRRDGFLISTFPPPSRIDPGDEISNQVGMPFSQDQQTSVGKLLPRSSQRTHWIGCPVQRVAKDDDIEVLGQRTVGRELESFFFDLGNGDGGVTGVFSPQTDACILVGMGDHVIEPFLGKNFNQIRRYCTCARDNFQHAQPSIRWPVASDDAQYFLHGQSGAHVSIRIIIERFYLVVALQSFNQ